MTQLLTEVRFAFKAGLTVLPVAEDGTKRPALPEWKMYQQRRPTADEMRQWNFAERAGYGMVGGPVSGHCESWDFDDAPTFEAFLAAAAATELADVIQRIRDGYEDETPNGGRRWIVKYPPDVTWADTVYARRPGQPGEKPVVTLIETTLFAVLAPSTGAVHPTGRPYVRVSGSFATIASYTRAERAAVIALARSFDQLPRREATPPRSSSRGDRPGDDFNRRASWREILIPHGWQEVGTHGGREYWRRPEKTFGISASANQETGLLWMFTSSTIFQPDVSYSKFGAYALLEHHGDYAAAALALAQRGYGVASNTTTSDAESSASSPSSSPGRQLQVTPATSFAIRPVHWLWQDRIALGALTLLGGREGIGKSICSAHLSAQVTNGTLPGRLEGQPRAVLIAAAEDSWQHTLVPRLMAAKADLARVFRVDVMTAAGLQVPLSLPLDLAALEREARQLDAGLLVFDPLLSRLEGTLDTHKDADVRRALEPLAAMAERVNVALIGLIHVTKSQSSDALTLLMGSRGFAGVARAVLFAMTDPEEATRRLLGQPKNNLGRTDLPTLTFEIDGVCVATTAEGDVWTGQLVWGDPTERSIQDALESLADQRSDREQVTDAGTWLVDYLTEAGGTASAEKIIEAAQRAKFSRTTLYTAKKKLKLQSDHRGFPRIAYWILSSQLSQSSQSSGTTGTTDTAESQSSESSQSSGVHGATPPRTTASDAQSSEDACHAGRRTTGTTGTTEAEPSWVTEDDHGPVSADEAAFAAHDDEEDT